MVALAAAVFVAGPAQASISPDRQFTSALEAARAQRSLHYVSSAVSPTVSVKMVGDAGLDRGIQRITYQTGGTGHVTVLVVADTAYLRGDAFALTKYMRFSSAEAASTAGRWMKISRTASWYSTVAAGVRLKSAISELKLRPPRIALPETILGGQRVVGLRSTSTASGRRVTDTLYVQATGARLPVAEIAREGASRFSVTFSKWNEPVNVSAPTDGAPA